MVQGILEQFEKEKIEVLDIDPIVTEQIKTNELLLKIENHLDPTLTPPIVNPDTTSPTVSIYDPEGTRYQLR